MADTAADVLVETLIDWGVEVIFGIPGDGINGIMESLRTRQDKVRFVQARHEEAAAFMACGYAKFTGRLGVCLATSGPGGIHLLNGLYDAKLDGAPVLAVTGMQFHDLISTHTQQDVELDKLFVDVCVYNARIMGPAHVENVVSLARRSALARRGVAHVMMPVDQQSLAATKDVRSERNIADHVSARPTQTRSVPAEADLRRAASLLGAGKKIAILVGAGAIGASAELEAIAERLAAPIVKPLLGKACIADTSPYTTGGIGLLGTKPSEDALDGCDTLLIVGSSFPYIEFYPKPGQARTVQIDSDAVRIGLRTPVEVGLVGDARATLAALAPLLARREDRSYLEQAQKGMAAWRELMHDRGTRMDSPMKPQVVAHELNKLLADDAIVTTDSGTITTWFARHIDMVGTRAFTLSGNLATMAPGLPYAIAAAVAFPGRQVVAFVGDGGLSMLLAELATCVKYGLDVKVVVIKNNTLGQIKWEQMAFLGNPEFACDLHPIDFVGVARACGGQGVRIERAEECGRALEQALGMPGLVLIEAEVDPLEPPMPPSTTIKQAWRMARSLARGTQDAGATATALAKDKLHEGL